MANLKEIRSRITSVHSTRQITSAMKMVSAAKLKRAQDAFYSSMFDGDEIEMLQAHAAVGYYESMEGTTCPEYPGF